MLLVAEDMRWDVYTNSAKFVAVGTHLPTGIVRSYEHTYVVSEDWYKPYIREAIGHEIRLRLWKVLNAASAGSCCNQGKGS